MNHHAVRRFCLDLLYPNRCPCCDAVIPWDRLLCDACEAQALQEVPTLCSGCGKEQSDCMCGTALAYEEAIGAFRYAGVIRSGLLSMKTSENRNFGTYAGHALGRKILLLPDWMDADGIVPVPMTRGKRLIRGFNQAAWIARGIAEITNLPLLEGCLEKRRGGRAQHTLTAAERARNIAQFQPGKREVSGRRLILCDDILTTGSTMNRCAALLKERGATCVYVAAAAVTCRTREENNQLWQPSTSELTSEPQTPSLPSENEA